jgi:hypothetical protein
VPADTQDADAIAARKRLQAVLDQLNPTGGKVEAVKPKAAKVGKKAGKAQKAQKKKAAK